MAGVIRLAGASAVALLAAAGLRYASLAPVETGQGAAAALRLSWSARPERVEQCRRLTDEELARRPAHMRLRLECEGSFARYELTVSLNGQVLSTDTIRGGGLRHDRPMHVFEEYRVGTGPQPLHVALVRIDSTSAPSDGGAAVQGEADTLLGSRELREVDERRRRQGEAIPAVLVLDTLVRLEANRTVLVTYDGTGRQLVVKGSP